MLGVLCSMLTLRSALTLAEPKPRFGDAMMEATGIYIIISGTSTFWNDPLLRGRSSELLYTSARIIWSGAKMALDSPTSASRHDARSRSSKNVDPPRIHRNTASPRPQQMCHGQERRYIPVRVFASKIHSKKDRTRMQQSTTPSHSTTYRHLRG